MLYWSETEGRWIKGESVWDGREPVTSAEGWVYRQSYLAQTEAKHDNSTRQEKWAKKCLVLRCPKCEGRMAIAPGSDRKLCLRCEPHPNKRKPNRCKCGNTMALNAEQCKACWSQRNRSISIVCSICKLKGTLCQRHKAAETTREQMAQQMAREKTA